jgi:hypothetical protein
MKSMGQAELAIATDLLTTEQLKQAWLRSEPIEFGNPVLANTRFELSETFFPLGFPATIETNSEAVLDAARECWNSFPRLFDTEPIRMQIGVTEGESNICPPMPVGRVRDHLGMSIADGENFAVRDSSQPSAMIWVTEAAVRHRDYFRYCFLESQSMGCIASQRATGIHAACVSLDGDAILLCGESGAGKSTLSYACASAGWTYVTDDGSFLVHGRNDRLVTGNCSLMRFRPSAEALFPHLHGLEVMQRAGVGKPSIEMPTRRGQTIRTSHTGNVRSMVFLKRGADTEELAAFPRAVARLYVEQHVYCMGYEPNRHMPGIDKLMEVETYELRYNSLDWAVERLTRLMREGQ